MDIPNSAEPIAHAKAYLQHIGAAITSRQAEDLLVAAGAEKARFSEPSFSGDAAAKIRANLAEAFGVADPAAILLTGSGMSAFHRGVRGRARRAGGRAAAELWLQIGWQYIDTTEILKKFLGPGEKFRFWPDVYDSTGLAEFFNNTARNWPESSSNSRPIPSLHAGDLPALHALCQKHGAILIADPTLASPARGERTAALRCCVQQPHENTPATRAILWAVPSCSTRLRRGAPPLARPRRGQLAYSPRTSSRAISPRLATQN